MIGKTLYVHGLTKYVKDDEVRREFEKFGKLDSLEIVRDPFTE